MRALHAQRLFVDLISCFGKGQLQKEEGKCWSYTYLTSKVVPGAIPPLNAKGHERKLSCTTYAFCGLFQMCLLVWVQSLSICSLLLLSILSLYLFRAHSRSLVLTHDWTNGFSPWNCGRFTPFTSSRHVAPTASKLVAHWPAVAPRSVSRGLASERYLAQHIMDGLTLLLV